MVQRHGLMPSLEAFDGELGGHDNYIDREPKGKNRLRFVALLGLLAGIGVIGALALAWSLTAVSSRPDSRSSEQIDALLREHNLLKKRFDEVSAAQEKSIAAIELLNRTVEKLRQRVPSDQYWYSDLAALYFRIANEPKLVAAPVPRMSAEAPDGEHRKNNSRRNPGVPLSLLPPQ